jgi:myosin protein heavy chain
MPIKLQPMGIISMLDEECVVPKGTDMSLAQKYIDTHVGKHPAIEKPKPPKGKQAEAHFALKHYAGLVRYNVSAWLEKNKDPLNDSVVAVLKNSTGNALVKTIWSDYQTQEEAAAIEKAGGARKKGKSGSMMTVSMMYRESLNNLMSMLNATHPHFVRCLIPNEIKTGGILDAGLVMNQLTCNGVLEGIRICRKGFPNRMAHDDFKLRYSLLAAAEAKSSDDIKLVSTAILDRLCSEGSMQQDNFRVGHTKVFFKAGILASMEDLRDAKLGSILSKLQAVIRWNITLKDAAKRQREMSGFTVLQKNIRSWGFMRNWPWFQIWAWLRPQLKSGKMAEEMKKAKKRIEEIEASLEKDASKTKELEVVNNKLKDETNEMAARLAQGSSGMKEVEDKLNKLNDQKKALEKELSGLNERLSEQEEKNAEVNRVVKKSETERENIKKTITDLEATLAKAEEDKAAKEAQIRSLQEEMHAQDESVAKNNKEKKHQEEINRKLQEDLQAEEDKWRHLQKAQQKIQVQMDDKEDQLEREKRVRGDVEKAKRKVEADLKLSQEKIDEINRLKIDAESNLKKKEADLLAILQRVEDEQTLVNKLQRQIKDLLARISELEEEVEAERSSRTKADRAKSDLQRELEELSERLDEAGGMTAAQVEVNKKREAELAKLRRDLEESNMNHENQLGALRKKHNDAVGEMGEQLDTLQKSKAKWVFKTNY